MVGDILPRGGAAGASALGWPGASGRTAQIVTTRPARMRAHVACVRGECESVPRAALAHGASAAPHPPIVHAKRKE